jgi:thioredoxin reductase
MGGIVQDVVIVGGGPAGLSAALMLGRCRRNVVVFDSGMPRNRASHQMHGYLTRDGIHPMEFLEIAREQVLRYPTVELVRAEITDAERDGNGFRVHLSDGSTWQSRKLLVATGVVDCLPPLDGLPELYGKSVFHCPYCDGWEVRGEPLAVYGSGTQGHGLALELTAWSSDLALCSDGACELGPEQRAKLERNGIRIFEERIDRLEGVAGILQRVVFRGGGVLERRALFFSAGQWQQSPLPERLGCDFNLKGTVATGKFEVTNIPGLFVAGDASHEAQLVIVAAAEGAEAGMAINRELIAESLK